MVFPEGSVFCRLYFDRETNERLKRIGIRTKLDNSDKSPGYKFAEQEMLGIPIRIEIGPKDIEKNEAIIVKRNSREKISIKLNELEKEIPIILESIQKEMYEKANDFLNEHIFEAKTLDEMKKIAKENIGFIKAMWCGNPECEENIKAETEGFGSRCIPEEQKNLSKKCIYCGQEAKHMVVWGKSY